MDSLELNGYTTYNFYRKFQHRRANRRSGGVIVYVRNEIKDGIAVVKNQYTIIWLKCNKNIFDISADYYVGVENSPVYTVIDVDLYDVLQNDIVVTSSFIR